MRASHELAHDWHWIDLLGCLGYLRWCLVGVGEEPTEGAANNSGSDDRCNGQGKVFIHCLPLHPWLNVASLLT